MRRTIIPLSALVLPLVLAACGENPPPGEPADPVNGASVAANPAAPIRPGSGPASFVGLWAADAAWCANTAATTAQVPIRITTERFEGYENSCAVTGIRQAGDGYDAALSCEAEGETYQERVNLRVRDDRLTLTWSDRGTEPVHLVRCEARPEG